MAGVSEEDYNKFGLDKKYGPYVPNKHPSGDCIEPFTGDLHWMLPFEGDYSYNGWKGTEEYSTSSTTSALQEQAASVGGCTRCPSRTSDDGYTDYRIAPAAHLHRDPDLPAHPPGQGPGDWQGHRSGAAPRGMAGAEGEAPAGRAPSVVEARVAAAQRQPGRLRQCQRRVRP